MFILDQSIGHFETFRRVIRHVLHESENLPSLPSITFSIRKAVADPDTSALHLARLVSQDPGLSALLIKYSSSPLYRTQFPITTLQGAINLLGMNTVSNIVMVHSVKSIFPMKNRQFRLIFDHCWKRQIDKATIAVFLASRLNYHSVDEVLIASLMSEVGSLAILSALNDANEIPDEEDFIDICRHYSKDLAMILLTKWSIDPHILNIVRHSGEWMFSNDGDMDALDIVNLALYYNASYCRKASGLPSMKSLPAYAKIPVSLNALSEDGKQLLLLKNNSETLAEISRSLY
ncbi:MAG: HDOD domain-containing protein [Pseudomonadales bacterium]|nr:HDOD domain-containing protein [Pseudomonadales bacterium]